MIGTKRGEFRLIGMNAKTARMLAGLRLSRSIALLKVCQIRILNAARLPISPLRLAFILPPITG